jgi:hypothetical protein
LNSSLSDDIPDWLTGVWCRRSIETADGVKDTTTQVFWLQTHRCFADLRIPVDRPSLGATASLHDLTPEGAIALAQQAGFAGVTTLTGDTCQWHRYIDYQPVSGDRDIGTLHWEGDRLIELGVDAEYREEWQRLDNSGDQVTALVLPEPEAPSSTQPSWSACVVTAGDYFIYARNRRMALPPAAALSALFHTATPDVQSAYLDCEFSFGVCQSGAVPWEIRLSTLPWRQGRSLWSWSDLTVDLEQQQVIQTIRTAQGDRAQQWQILEWNPGML